MANTAQAKKRARQAEKARVLNTSLRSRLRTQIKKVDKAVAGGDKTLAEQVYRQTVPIIDKMATKGIIHKNKAARHKSRLNKHIRILK